MNPMPLHSVIREMLIYAVRRSAPEVPGSRTAMHNMRFATTHLIGTLKLKGEDLRRLGLRLERLARGRPDGPEIEAQPPCRSREQGAGGKRLFRMRIRDHKIRRQAGGDEELMQL